ncbi:MAG TPA: outer membrane beta-barrel protein [Chitinophagaceae bacterium]|nr:outer membrane beta-barrel protein [Chitinophagaceae bacterium]
MNQRFTPEDLFRGKLADTPVPDWKEGWRALEPLLEATEVSRPSRTLPWWKQLSAAAAIALVAGLSAWWLYSGPGAGPASGTPPGTAVILPEESLHGVPAATGHKGDDPDPLTPGKSLEVTTYPAIREAVQTVADTFSVAVSASSSAQEYQAVPALPYPPASQENVLLKGVSIRISLSVLPEVLPLTDKNPARQTVHDLAQARPPAVGDVPVSLVSPEAVSVAPAKEKSSSGYYVAVRLNANGASSFGHAASNFSPVLKGTPVDVYPAVTVGRRFGGKFSLQAGLAIASPVDVQKEGLNRSVSDPLRAMRANVLQSDDSVNLSRLYYVDVPLTVQYHLNKEFSVGSGLQLSVLEKVIGEKQRLDYNTAGYVAMALPERPEPENLTQAKSASGTISPVDLRWVIGLYYQAGKHWNASLQYQCGLTDISNDRAFLNNHVNRNNIIRAGIGFVIR